MLFLNKSLNLFILTLVFLVGTSSPGGNQCYRFGVSAIAETGEERKQEGDRLFDLGVQQYQRSQFHEASQSWEQALNIYREIGDKAKEARTLGNLGEVYLNWGEYARAEYHFNQALEIAKEIGNKTAESRSLNDLGEVYLNWAEYARAEYHFNQALDIAEQIGDRAIESRVLSNLGEIYRNWAEYARAENSFNRSLEIAEKIGDKAAETRILSNLGTIYLNWAEYARAEHYLNRSLEIAEEIGDKLAKSRTLDRLSEVYRNWAEYARAEYYLKQALELAEQLGNKAGEGNILNNWATVYQSRGEYANAEEFYQRSLQIAKAIGNPAGESSALLGLGTVYFNLGDYTKAEDFYQRSFGIKQLIGDKAGQGIALSNLGTVYFNLGEYQKAEEFYLRSLEIKRLIGDKAGEGVTLRNLGNIYRNLREYDKAEEFYQDSLELAKLLGDKAGEGNTLNNLGMVYFNRGEYDRAEELFQQALQIALLIGDRSLDASARLNLGLIYQNRGEYPEAEKSYLASIEASEQLRPGLTDEQKISLFEQHAKAYEFLQNVLVTENKTDTALEISERGRARAFVELLAARLSDIEENSFAVSPPNLTQIKQIAAAQNATIVQYSYIRDRFSVGTGKELVESELYIWVVNPTGEIAFRRSDLKSLWQQQENGLAKLIANARCFDNFICRRNITVALGRDGIPEVRSDRSFGLNSQTEQPPDSPLVGDNTQFKQLYQLLIAPIADLLPNNPSDRVIFIPHQSLFLVPFPALQDASGQYLVEKHTILTAPSIQLLDLTQKQKQNRAIANPDILIVGNPTMPMVGEMQLSPLEGAEREARDIGELLNVSPLIGSQATESAVVQKMLSSRLIHLATHGSFDPNVPLESWLALTPSGTENGLLTAAEIFGLQLNAELVVLSACDTGRGKITGDGVVGLSRAFLSAGTPSVLVSLWQVPDDATYLLMRKFYQVWQQSGDKAQALREAMLTTMQQHPHPEAWAGFTLMGEAE